MAEPFLGEIRIVSFNFPPKGWAMCNGQLLPINQNQALFSLFGTTYGGNGQTTFALPEFRGRTPIHFGAGFTQGQAAGQEFHTVTVSELPAHNHAVQGVSATGNTLIPNNNFFATSPAKPYSGPANLTPVHPDTITNVGGSQPHENRMPYLVLNFVVALQGIFPSQN
jgi:microcystin-dependent protein